MCSNLGNICGNVRLDDLKDFLVWQKPSSFCSQYFLREKKSESENIQHFPEQSSKYWNFSAVNNSFFWCLFLTGSFNPLSFPANRLSCDESEAAAVNGYPSDSCLQSTKVELSHWGERFFLSFAFTAAGPDTALSPWLQMCKSLTSLSE